MSRLFFQALAKLKESRKQKKVSQLQAGLIIGCNQSQYGKKERGQQQFTLLEFCILAEYFEIAEEVITLFVL